MSQETNWKGSRQVNRANQKGKKKIRSETKRKDEYSIKLRGERNEQGQ